MPGEGALRGGVARPRPESVSARAHTPNQSAKRTCTQTEDQLENIHITVVAKVFRIKHTNTKKTKHTVSKCGDKQNKTIGVYFKERNKCVFLAALVEFSAVE